VRLSILLAVVLAIGVHAAERPPQAPNTIYVEFLGNGVLYSLNYDRLITSFGQLHHVGARVGVSLMPVDTLGTQYPLLFPIMANYLIGPKQHKLEVGAGITPSIWFDDEWELEGRVAFAASVGYRYHRFDNDFDFRVAFTPLFFEGFKPWFGLSFGRAF